MKKPDGRTPAERAVDSMTPEQLRAAASRGNKIAQRILAKQQKAQAKSYRKAAKAARKRLKKAK